MVPFPTSIMPYSGFSRDAGWAGRWARLLAAAPVWAFGAGWPDLLIAAALLMMFLRFSSRVLRAAWRRAARRLA